ncbi:hypothetical protein B0H19DRAFT_422009 [Mycena capillaripes]|nr:hypothetical protein B0H19DRAFT_422009 [Mycena capillaripes]
MHPDPHTHDTNQQTFAPLQLKGEIMDLEFTMDTDHRKRRRNRTTQSCLNCHTSKRKCDRKRPCQRCIQLGLTGLCVYEIDDPALRDDPSVDENTRLRNRIAELESLVRELRGKPHPRWADSNFRDGDPNEKWHSRATKCAPLNKQQGQQQPRRHSPDPGPRPPALLPPIKTEIGPEPASHLYRFSASPGPRSGYPPFPDRSGSFEGAGAGYDGYPLSGSDDGQGYAHGGHYSPSSAGGSGSTGASGGRNGSASAAAGYCPCRASPGMAHAYISLSQALQTTLSAARTYATHPPGTPCVLFRRIADLASLMQGTDPTDPAGPAYDSNTPTDSEVLTPLSASASSVSSFHNGNGTGSPASAFHGSPGAFHAHPPSPPGAFHAHPPSPGTFPPSPGHGAYGAASPGGGGGGHGGGHGGGGGHDWGVGGYSPYFPIGGGEHMYGAHVIT